MKQFLSSLWWWTRVIVLVVVGLYALALLWKNSSQTASIWYWPGRPAEETNIMALALASFLSGGLIMTIGWALGTAMVNLRRTRAARKKRAAALQREEIERKASMLRVKPAPAPIVRPRVEAKPAQETKPALEAKPAAKPTPDPMPVVEPMPEVTLAPSPVVVIKPAQVEAAKPATVVVPKTLEEKKVETPEVLKPSGDEAKVIPLVEEVAPPQRVPDAPAKPASNGSASTSSASTPNASPTPHAT